MRGQDRRADEIVGEAVGEPSDRVRRGGRDDDDVGLLAHRDVSGRAVKTVAKRVFAGGQEHVVVWDGTDDAGHRVKSGVYFYRLQTPTWSSQKKLALLSN